MSDNRARETVRDWYEQHRAKSVVGVASAGLVVLEIWRDIAHLTEPDVITKGGGQIVGLSGRAAHDIISRFVPNAPRIGREAGRTSRGTPEAARRLVGVLNDFSDLVGPLKPAQRKRYATVMQRWIAENPIRAYYERQRLKPELGSQKSVIANIAAILSVAQERSAAGPVAQHLVAAKLELRFPDLSIPNHATAAADVQTGRMGDFTIEDSVLHVTVAPTQLLIAKCEENIRAGYRPVVIVPEERRLAAGVLAELSEHASGIEVFGLESFVGQNIEEIGGFSQIAIQRTLRRLLEAYNRRIEGAESDRSLMIDIPPNL